MKKILIVEDHPDMRDLLVKETELMGFVAIPAKHGQEGVEAAAKEKPDLILMDMRMPGMDGWQATRLIRSKPETRNIPIVAATVLSAQSDLRSCIEAGCNDCLIKPFTFQELQKKVKELIPLPATGP